MADCAIFILWDSSNKLALMENRPDLNPEVDRYWVYPGGKVELNESIEHAMRRECFEELGVIPTEYRRLDSKHELRSHPRPGTKQYAKAHEGWRTIPYLVTQWIGDVPDTTLDDNKAGLLWVDPAQIANEQINEYTCNVQIATLLTEV